MAVLRNQLSCRFLLAICITLIIAVGADQDLLHTDTFGCESINISNSINLTDFNEVHVFPQHTMTYDDMVKLHPSLNIIAIIPDSRFQMSELPPINLDTSGTFN